MENGATIAEILGAGQWRSPAFLRYLDLADLERDAVAEAHMDESSDEDGEAMALVPLGVGELAADDAFGDDPLDGETGTLEPETLDKKESALLEQEGVAALVEAKLATIPDDPASIHNPMAVVKDVLAEIVESGVPPTSDASDLSDDAAQYEKAFPTWLRNFQEGIQAGRMAAGQRTGQLPPPSGHASLLLREVNGACVTNFIHWPKVKKFSNHGLEGREVLVDLNGNFIFSVGNAFPLITFQTKQYPGGCKYTTLIADVGARMEQVKESERPHVPRDVLRYRDMVDTAAMRHLAAAEAVAAAASASSGSASSSAPAAPVPIPKPAAATTISSRASGCLICLSQRQPKFTCCLCLQDYHNLCDEKFSTWALGNGHLAQVALPRTEFIHLFRETLCLLCAKTDVVGFTE